MQCSVALPAVVAWPRTVASGSLAYYQTGTGAPVVLVHGVGLRAESWCSQIDALAAAHMVYAVDMPGHGDTPKLAHANAGLACFSQVLAAFVREVVGAPVILIGHSMGALVVLDFARRYAELCLGVAALSAVYRRSAQAKQQVLARATAFRQEGAVAVNETIDRWFGEHPAAATKEALALCRYWLEQATVDGYSAAYLVFAGEDGPDDSSLAALSMPALFLSGEDDRNSSPLMAKTMAYLTPHGRALSISGARHMVQLTHPQAVNPVLQKFCSRCLQAASNNNGCV